MDSLINLTGHQELGQAQGSYLLKSCPPCLDLGEVWSFLLRRPPLFVERVGLQSTTPILPGSSQPASLISNIFP